MAGRRRKKRKQNGNGKIWISIIVATLLIVMSVQIVGLYNKKETYMAKESSLKTQLEDEKKSFAGDKRLRGIHQDTEVH